MKENYNGSSGWNPHVSIHPQVPLHSVSARSRPTAAESFVERRPSQRRGRCRAEAWRLQPQPSPGDGLQVIHLSLTFSAPIHLVKIFPSFCFCRLSHDGAISPLESNGLLKSKETIISLDYVRLRFVGKTLKSC